MAPLEDVYCTLLMSDSYLPGAAVLANSLRDAGTTKKLAVLITLDTLSASTVEQLKSLYDYLIPVEHIRNPHPANLYLMGRPDLAFAFTKIALWRQTQFRKIVYMDADMVALRALDELFDLDADFAAAPDIGWPDAFNTGLMVLSPNMGDYWALKTMSAAGDSFDGADQGLLNQYYQHRAWHRLSFAYNCTPNAEYQWEPAYRYYKSSISAVHFIGKDKPWSSAQKGSGGSGTHGELLARWWAVHDKHFKAPTPHQPPVYGSSKQYGQGEAPSTHIGTSPADSSAPIPNIIIEPEASVTTTEAPLSEPGEPAENIDHGVVEPVPTAELRKFSAPQMEWDATLAEPPIVSRPEAANFPKETYVFNESRKLFNAPRSYPEPPKDMWYSVPETKPTPAAKPKPIFPWENQADRPKPTRVFAEDLQSPPMASPVTEEAPASGSVTNPFATVHYEEEEPEASMPDVVPSSSERAPAQIADAFQQSNVNAWDAVPGIDTYVRAIMDSHARRANPQVVYSNGDSDEILTGAASRKDRRESLLITDFPSAVERPSLPVTPAPRPTFWGQEKNTAAYLPAAEGVPDQSLWNPEEKLEELRRSSLLEFEHLKAPVHPEPPLRALPEHSVPGPGAPRTSSAEYGLGGTSDPKPNQTEQEPPVSEMPLFKEPDFSGESSTPKAEEVLSPTEEQ